MKPTTALNGAHLSSDSNTLNGVHGQHYIPSLSGASTPASTASPGPVSAEVYFASHVAPKSLSENAEKIRTFVDHHMHDGRRVVLVTVSFFFLWSFLVKRDSERMST
jgi:phosphopantothenate-cysteine ligase